MNLTLVVLSRWLHNQQEGISNILELLATNRSSLVRHIKMIPGISDHEIVSIEKL